MIVILLRTLFSDLGSRRALALEDLAFRHQLEVLERVQHLVSGAERREVIGGLHEIRLRHRGLLHHNIFVSKPLRVPEGRAEIGGPLQQGRNADMNSVV